jgi:hypothetical protein
MILISKVVFGSVAVATLAGSVVFTDAVEAARNMASTLQWGSTAAVQPTGPQQPVAERLPVPDTHQAPYAVGQFPSTLQHCPGRCDIGLLFSIR